VSPQARIKKILQADEDVGRVNQATPAVISTAVELFLESLIKAAVAALPDGVTTLTPTHLYVTRPPKNRHCTFMLKPAHLYATRQQKIATAPLCPSTPTHLYVTGGAHPQIHCANQKHV